MRHRAFRWIRFLAVTMLYWLALLAAWVGWILYRNATFYPREEAGQLFSADTYMIISPLGNSWWFLLALVVLPPVLVLLARRWRTE